MCIFRAEQISGNLFAHKLIVRQILVEGSDDVVPVGVGEGVLGFPGIDVAFSIGVTGNIQPAPAPALTVLLRCQQLIDKFHHRLQWIGRVFVFEGSHLGTRRRQADQVKVGAANERSRQGFRRWAHSGFTECSEDKVIERRAWPSAIRNRWNRWICNGLKSPMFPLLTLRLTKR